MSMAIGIDVSKSKLDVVLLREDTALSGTFDNTPAGFQALHRWLVKRQATAVAVGLEATGRYGDEVALFLHEQGYVVSVLNPVQIKAFGQSQLSRNKTDAADAALIARFVLTQTPPPWTPPAPELRQLQALVRHRDDLQATRQQELNRLQALPPSPLVQSSLQQHLDFLDAQIREVEQHIRNHIDHHPDLKRQHDLLDSIPGIGPLTACILLAELPAWHHFPSAAHLAAFAGVTPKQHRSGSSVQRHSRISKMGNARLRDALYFPAIVASRHNPLLRPLAARLKARGHAGLSVIVAVMRKLLHLVYGVLKSGLPFDPDFRAKRLAAA